MRVSFPGFFDLQVNGFSGVDFNSPGRSVEEIQIALGALRATGVTRCLPTLVSSSLDDFAACVRQIAATGDETIAGFHMEGPYISPLNGARGAHPLDCLREPSIDDFRRRQEAADGHIVLVTLAPELSGALPLIEQLVREDVRVAIGHTMANGSQIQAAISAGAMLSTHLGNGCPEMLHRHDNVIWEQLAAENLCACVIADGHHLPDAVLKSMVRAKGLYRTILVTDATAAAAAEPGCYMLGSVAIRGQENGYVSTGGSTYLAGSALTMDKAVGNVVRVCGLALEDVLPMATTNPARVLGMEPAGEVVAEWDAVHHRFVIEEARTEADDCGISRPTDPTLFSAR